LTNSALGLARDQFTRGIDLVTLSALGINQATCLALGFDKVKFSSGIAQVKFSSSIEQVKFSSSIEQVKISSGIEQ
jgi:hypothetical protein